MKTLILFLLASVAVAEKIGSFKEFDVHHMLLEASSEVIPSYKFFEDERDSRILNGNNTQLGHLFVCLLSLFKLLFTFYI